ncbi:hypothetical protein [uncultured Fibrobacter sp.]|uniref:hypothetical protein n=1 Tax=uncultured Fibrobacter sp. TaxID=261512 RepID=UPI00262B0E19|nr:hypothetical protein [uncultured Fibrobacter sp.]
MGRHLIRYIAIVILLLSSMAVAQPQEELYYRALKAEEAGDIPRALNLFEQAVAVSGPYTAEIQEIIDDYREVLGESGGDSLEGEPADSWEFHTYGNIGFMGLHYKRSDISEAETGSEISSSVSVSAEYDSKNWNHSFEINMAGDWFIDKDDMPSLDTNAWEASMGVAYSLVGSGLILDLGTNINFADGEDWAPDFYAWFEKYLARFDRQKIGLALWAYENTEGPLSTAVYASWHRYVKYGWKSSIYLGGRFEADSVSYPYWLKWVGPSLKPSFSYRFKTEISIDAKLNLFYGFVVDGPDADYEEVQKFNASWSCSVSWMPSVLGVYLGVEQFYKAYVLPSGYTIGYPERSTYTEFKVGAKWNI